MLVIGLDVGTTGTKAIVADEKGTVLASGYREYPLVSRDGRVTQDAWDWWDATVRAIHTALQSVDSRQVRAIGISTQGASMLAADKHGNPLCEVITWMDTRAAREADALSSAIGKEEIYRKCGWLPNPSLDAAKILWMRQNELETFSTADTFISTLEFINLKLTGKNVIDPTNAAIRQLFDMETGTWDDEILHFIGISRERLPQVLPVGSAVGTLTPEAAAELGLSAEVTVFNGAHDQYCASIGSGAVDTGDMLLATGTTWVVLGVTDRLLYTENHICPGSHPVKGKFGAMASLVSAGSALNWYRDIVGTDFRTMDSEAATRAEGTKDLFALPYVLGAGFPHNRPELRGAMFGLDAGHDRYHIARAIMEGVAFEASIVLEQFAAQGMRIDKLMMTGGAARSDLWSEIVGYVTGCEIYRPREPETCCLGAAMIAFVGLGVYDDFNACRSAMVKSSRLELSDQSMYDFYREKGRHYRALIQKLL